MKMNKYRAKMLLVLDNLIPDLRYCEYLSLKLEKYSSSVNVELRNMERLGWISMIKYKHRKIVTRISPVVLDEAKAFLETQVGPNDAAD